MHDDLLTALNREPNTRYCYRYGSPRFKYNQEQSFVSAIKPGSDTPFKTVAYRDMDTSLPSGSFTTAALVRKDVESLWFYMLAISAMLLSKGIAGTSG